MPGLPLLGARYFQEIAPGAALDRAEVIQLNAQTKTPYGVFSDVLVTEETTPLEPDARETKKYAPGIGQIVDAELRLTDVVIPWERVSSKRVTSGRALNRTLVR